jgi:hypothetical protein
MSLRFHGQRPSRRAFLVDIEDHDALVDPARQRHAQAQVVDDVVEPAEQIELAVRRGVPLGGVADEEKR